MDPSRSPLLPSQLSWKRSLLLTCQILGLLVGTLDADDKYPILNEDNLTIQIQMQLSQEQKTFSQFLVAFWKPRLNFKHFQKKDDPDTSCIFGTTDSINVVRQISKQCRFRGPFNKQEGTCVQALLKAASKHL